MGNRRHCEKDFGKWHNAEWLKLRIKRLEAKENKNPSKHRTATIEKTKVQLDLVLTATSSVDGVVNLDSKNKNVREALFVKKATNAGWSVIHRGWPDYLCWRGDEIAFVEVKPERESLSQYQELVMDKLAALGLRCYKWTPTTGMKRITPKPRKTKKS